MLSFLNEINVTITEIIFFDNLFFHIYFNLYKYLFTQNVCSVAQRKPREGGDLFCQEKNVKNSYLL